jgi:hypothetical protein
MDFPRMVFTSPGPHVCNGGTYGHTIVDNAEDLAAALKAEWFPTLPEALEAADKKALTAAAPKASAAAPAPKVLKTVNAKGSAKLPKGAK